MKTIPLYPGSSPPPLACEREEPLADDKGCQRCKLNDGSVKTPCMPPAGRAGGLLIVGEAPGRNEDVCGKPFVGPSGRQVAAIVQRSWNGPVLVTNALRCAPGNKRVTPTMVKRCRPYLAKVVIDSHPTRIVCLGAKAALSVTGRGVAPLSIRGGYTFTRDRIPVFFVLHPAAGLRNRFVMEWFQRDLTAALTLEPPEPNWGSEVRLITTPQESAAAAYVLAKHVTAFDVETAGKMWCQGFEIIALSACVERSSLPLVWGRHALANRDVLAPLLRWLGSSAPKVGQNVKFDRLAVRCAWGIEVGGVVSDTRLVRKLLEPEASGALDDMAELVGMGGMKDEAKAEMTRAISTVKRNLKKWKEDPSIELHPMMRLADQEAVQLGAEPERFAYALLGNDELARYNARDALATIKLHEHLQAGLQQESELSGVWGSTVGPAAAALVHVEGWGVAVDEGALDLFTEHLASRMQEITTRLSQYPDVNWGSTLQVQRLLYQTLDLPVIERTPTGQPSTSAAVLEKLRDKHPVVAALLDRRFVEKLRGTYADGMREHIRDDGRVHPNIMLDGARSGRTSCSEPNLQNIVRAQSIEGKMARNIFVASEGYFLAELDYSQLELRVAAMLSGDPLMREIYEEGIDYHRRTAELVAKQAWGVEPEQVEDRHRSIAKNFNFGMLYGQSDKALAAKIGCSVAQAADVRAAILGKFTRLNKWCAEQLRYVRTHGHSWTWWGGKRYRRRPMFRIADADSESRSRAENGSVNTPIQGTASDFCINSLAACVEWILSEGLGDIVKLILPVHDSLLFDVREDMVPEVLHTVREIMTGWPSQGVPLVVDAKVGRSWGEMKDVNWEEL